MATQFSWIPLYSELADELSKWEDRQTELIAFLENLRQMGFVITPLMDRDEDGASFLLREIDPFTFFGVFNRSIRQDQRIGILSEMKKFFNLKSDLPVDFDAVPVLNNMKSWFVDYKKNRQIEDVHKLWVVFKLALSENPTKHPDFVKAFDDALTVRCTNVNLTMGLFWIRPNVFINLDNTNRTYLNIHLPPKGFSAKFYLDTLDHLPLKGKTYPQISMDAWNSHVIPTPPSDEEKNGKEQIPHDIDYWLVGAKWSDQEQKDSISLYLKEGIWTSGSKDRYHTDINAMKVGDKIAIKSTTTQRHGLPFDGRNKTVSRMDIKAIGTITANRQDGKTIEVEWEPTFQEKSWYFYTTRNPIWHIAPVGKKVWEEAAQQLIDFVWFGKVQDYEWFIKQWWDLDQPAFEPGDEENIPYSIEDIIAEGVFLEAEELKEIISRLSDKKAIILQGPPGVGKTFVAKKLAYALMGEIDKDRVEFIQFHQSYSYDDFVRGYRPLPEKDGAFGIKDGIFYEFCQKALEHPDDEYIFIIDEINRGNLSQIFGELLVLIEHDKRGEDHSVQLVYRKSDEPRFHIPHNVYLIGLMNLADRSLAMVDYALRRRFAFISLQPKFESQLFKNWLTDREMSTELVSLIVSRLSALNQRINDDPLLGENYQIGHSYFCPSGEDFSVLDKNWYQSIVQTEIVPLIKEYWFDNPAKASEATRILQS